MDKKAYATEYRRINREFLNGRARAYREKPGVTERKNAWQRAFFAQNPETVRAYQREYYERNRERMLVRKKAMRERRLEKSIAWRTAYVAQNREKVAAQQKASRERNRENVLAVNRAYRTRRRGAAGRHTAADVLGIWERQCRKCAVSGCKYPISDKGKDKYHVDHMQPISRGGSNGPENLQILCGFHNIGKKDQDYGAWLTKMAHAEA